MQIDFCFEGNQNKLQAFYSFSCILVVGEWVGEVVGVVVVSITLDELYKNCSF